MMRWQYLHDTGRWYLYKYTKIRVVFGLEVMDWVVVAVMRKKRPISENFNLAA